MILRPLSQSPLSAQRPFPEQARRFRHTNTTDLFCTSLLHWLSVSHFINDVGKPTVLTWWNSVIYILWSYLPSPFLHQLGIYYYPNRWWSLAFPSWLVMSIVYIYIALASYNTGYLTLPMNSIENIVDEVANVSVIDGRGRRRPGGSSRMKPGATSYQIMGPQQRKVNWKDIWSEGTDAVMDVPVGGVCEVLYGQGRDDCELYESAGITSPGDT